ncbi:MAG TPA: hypothetical protein VI861_02550 [Rickettsiales bacterium]|nr:hypothetical protein [Rickettsiales bacterium]
MNDLLAYFTLRSVLLFASTAFSLVFLMLVLNIITVDEVIAILNLPPHAATAFKTVISRFQEVTGNIIDIISQLLNKLFGFAGVDVDLEKIKVDPNVVTGTNEAAKDISKP